MNGFIHNSLPAWAVAAALLVTGCETPTASLVASDVTGTLESQELATAELATVLTAELDLTSSQQAALHADIQRYDRPDVRPGNLWYLSARLEGYLDDRQLAKLLQLADRLDDRQLHKLVGVYAACVIERPDDADAQLDALAERIGARGGNAEAHVAAGREAMIEALGLRDEQIAALDALHRIQCGTLGALVRQVHGEEISREVFHEGLQRLVDAKSEAYSDILNTGQLEAAGIHDALLVIHARRFVHYVTDGGPNRRPGPGGRPGPDTRPAPDTRSGTDSTSSIPGSSDG